MQDKDKKIAELRGMLLQAKKKLQDNQQELKCKDIAAQEAQNKHQLAVSQLNQDSKQIVQQYEQRLQRYQASLDEAQEHLAKQQRITKSALKAKEDLHKSVAAAWSLTSKVFCSPLPDSAVEELCEIQKCKEYLQELARMGSEHEPITKSLSSLAEAYHRSLVRKRQMRLTHIKKQGELLRAVERQQSKRASLDQEVGSLREKIHSSESRKKVEMDRAQLTKGQKVEEDVNIEFTKQMVLKLLSGPRQAAAMALEVLSKLLRFNAQEKKLVQSHI